MLPMLCQFRNLVLTSVQQLVICIQAGVRTCEETEHVFIKHVSEAYWIIGKTK